MAAAVTSSEDRATYSRPSKRTGAAVIVTALNGIAVLRAYARYLRQCGTPFSQDTIEGALQGNVDIARLLVRRAKVA